ncbi:pyridoxal phosphate-dependent transferase [Xylariales sp. AK1849]|nr:pyridoxal phosphate-dependent transferase [Xylariales sp. AK1849]
MLDQIPPGPMDPMFFLKKKAEEDTSPNKVDVGVGVYRNEDGKYQELDVYQLTTGDEEFLRLAGELIFGESNELLKSGRVSSVQTLSGTGANHLGALVLATNIQPNPKVFVGVPSWGNTIPLFHQVGLETQTYRYLDPVTKHVDFLSCIQAMKNAPRRSVFSLQGCCQNPVGADFTPDQWRVIAQELKARNHLPFIDIAYQGLGDGLDEDAIGLRIVAETCPEMIVCQSFSKNFALYGERCGALHVLARSQETADNVKDQLRSLIRREYSSSPAFGSRLVKIVLADTDLRKQWVSELFDMRKRLRRNRDLLFKNLTARKTPGEWRHIVEDKGLFSCLSLTPAQCKLLNIKYTAHAIDAVICEDRVGQIINGTRMDT